VRRFDNIKEFESQGLLKYISEADEAQLSGRGLSSEIRTSENLNTESNNTTVFRVQGGTPPKASRRHIIIDDNGNPKINETTLNISTGDPEHARYFLNKRPGADITSFEIPKWMDEFLQSEAVPQLNYKSNPLNQDGLAPKIVDPSTPGTSYELPPVWAKWLEEVAIPGSGKVIK
jgi:hypothetical protein